MKLASILLFFFVSIPITQAQQMNPVKWKVEVLSESDTELEIAFIADIKTGWAIYSQSSGDDGPIPTTFTFDENQDIEFLGDVLETTEVHTAFDELFETEVAKMKGKAVFVQKIKKTKASTKFSGTITYMCCDNDKCLPPKDVPFSLDL